MQRAYRISVVTHLIPIGRIAGLLLVTACCYALDAGTMSAAEALPKPRVIATTDGEVDDRSSMVRFLLYTCDFDVVGIVEVNSKYQKRGHSGEKWIQAQLDAYKKVLPNLRKHNSDYPDTGVLRSVMRVGNENIDDLWVAPPEMKTKDTAGAQLIIDTLLDADPRPVHVLSWGGANTTASALWKLKLTATATDPDGDELTYKWWRYADADSATANVTIANRDSAGEASFVVPDEPGKQIHIILEVTDNGTPPLVGYQRIICKIH